MLIGLLTDDDSICNYDEDGYDFSYARASTTVYELVDDKTDYNDDDFRV